MKWLYRHISRRIREVTESDDCGSPKKVGASNVTSLPDGPAQGGIEFRVTRANGGHVISTRFWDKTKHEEVLDTYIINDGADFGAELGKIITMETLKR